MPYKQPAVHGHCSPAECRLWRAATEGPPVPTQRSRSRLRRRAGPSVSPSPSWRQKQQRRWSRGSGSGRRHTPSLRSSRSTSSSVGSEAAWAPPRGSVTRRLQRHQRECFSRFMPWRDEEEDEEEESSPPPPPPPPGKARGRGFSFTVTCQSKRLIGDSIPLIYTPSNKI